MKLENESGFAVQAPPRKSYNPFESDEEDNDGFVSSHVNTFDIKSLERNADSLTFHLDNGDLSWEEAILSQSAMLSHAIPVDANGEEGLFRKDTELFTDKTVTECELPELMVCYRENAYQSVKDIGIDEGVPAHDKVWIKTRDNHEDENLVALNGDTNSDPSLKNEFQDLPDVEGLKSRPEDYSVKNAASDSEELKRHHSADQCGTDESIKVDEGKLDLSKMESSTSLQSKGYDEKTGIDKNDLTDHHGESNYTEENQGNEFSMEEDSKDNLNLEHVKESATKPSSMNSTKSSENEREEATSPQPSELPTPQDSAGSGVTNVLSYNSKVESGSIILDFNSSSTAPGKEKEAGEEVMEKEKEHQNVAIEEPPETETTPAEKLPETQTTPAEKLQETQSTPAEKLPETQGMPLENPPKTQTMSRHDEEATGMDRWGHGETSFSADMPPPASITYMGPNARCGSTSLRSESSTGSTRSFAFPVLQAEWNTSPVRMAKADQRHYRKQRGWVHSVMCCKF